MNDNGHGKPRNGLMGKILTAVVIPVLTTVVIFGATRWAQVGTNTDRLDRLEKTTTQTFTDIRRLIELGEERRRQDSAEQRLMLIKILERDNK